jgi:hypothetical protein
MVAYAARLRLQLPSLVKAFYSTDLGGTYSNRILQTIAADLVSLSPCPLIFLFISN